jgi:hypothetical protein
MVTKAEPPGPRFKVRCAWCGAVIRLREGKDSEGMCEGCFRRLLDKHLRPQPQGKASDR